MKEMYFIDGKKVSEKEYTKFKEEHRWYAADYVNENNSPFKLYKLENKISEMYSHVVYYTDKENENKIIYVDKKALTLFLAYDENLRYTVAGEFYIIHIDDYDRMMKLIKTVPKTYKIKNSNSHFYFKVGEEMLPSSTPNWYDYLDDIFGPLDFMVEECNFAWG